MKLGLKRLWRRSWAQAPVKLDTKNPMMQPLKGCSLSGAITTFVGEPLARGNSNQGCSKGGASPKQSKQVLGENCFLADPSSLPIPTSLLHRRLHGEFCNWAEFPCDYVRPPILSIEPLNPAKTTIPALFKTPY